ncbi:Uncharacterised protein [Vibrio cholerae]|nr:Uncharacterised protein [Vibrio cholerae]
MHGHAVGTGFIFIDIDLHRCRIEVQIQIRVDEHRIGFDFGQHIGGDGKQAFKVAWRGDHKLDR